ncbi:alpha/beta-hydrolase [Penicillium canescens]|nr:alpha/beta-hydrolase [Penicillium canescens]
MPLSPFFDLMSALSALDVNKHQPFEVITTQYKTFEQGSTGISTDILIPKELIGKQKQTKCSILVRIHGGFLVTGSSRYAPWFSNWILDFAIKSQAVIVSPNYRLLPEASGQEILQDMEDFWNWLHTGGLVQPLEESGHPCIIPDQDNILIIGESAGGYLAVQLGLSKPSKIRGVVAAYPMLDLKTSFYTEAYPKPIVGVPNLPSSLVEEHLAANRTGGLSSVITEADPPERLELAFSIVQNGRFLEFFGRDNPNLFPMDRIESLSASEGLAFPPFFYLPRRTGLRSPCRWISKICFFATQKIPNVRLQLYIQDGDHGFDVAATLETPWLKDGLGLVSSDWLNATSGLSHL